ncbi:MAG TPA: NPCBM/NEW2 domain-containing protein, partial [Verrucomicrobiae bacterium]
SSLTFRVVGNGRVLWQSRPTRRSGEWQECNIPVEGVRLLELQVDCPGVKTFAWAAWADPRLDP